MKVCGVIKEAFLESRVSMVPEMALKLIKQKMEVLVEAGAGEKAGFLDEDYIKIGAKIIKDKEELFFRSSIILSIEAYNLPLSRNLENKIVLGFFDPFNHKSFLKNLNENSITALALELVPRISKAQSMDALSSQANLAGYVAVLFAANRLNKIMPMLMTAAGTISPAKVLVLGAGVAGLSAIATAKRLGAVVYGYDVRKAVKEQVESFGAKFVDLKIDEEAQGQGGYAKALSANAQIEQRKALTSFAKDFDVIITTAQIPGQKAPKLLDEEIFSLMKKDSIIIDLACQSGGNVLHSVLGQWQKIGQVLLYGAEHLARQVPKDASFTYSKNIVSLLDILYKNNSENADFDDEIIKAMMICYKKNMINPQFLEG